MVVGSFFFVVLGSRGGSQPPNIVFLTPNGRFEVGMKICLTVSAHHPETWQPSWSIRTGKLIGYFPALFSFADDTRESFDCNHWYVAVVTKASVLFVMFLLLPGFMPTPGGGAIGSIDYSKEVRQEMVSPHNSSERDTHLTREIGSGIHLLALWGL